MVSCSDNADIEQTQSEYKFQKALTISDDKGNSVDLLIHANSEDDLAAQTSDVLMLNTSTKEFTTANTHTESFEAYDVIDETEEHEVFILVTDYKMNDDITGFNVRSKLESHVNNEIDPRAYIILYHYIYGSTGITGVSVEYLSQTCDQEFLKATFSKKNNLGILWHRLAHGQLNDVGDEWTYNGSYNYYQFRLKIRTKNQCIGTASYGYNWLT